MSSGVDVGWEESLPPAPESMSPELAEYFDALEDSLLEAAACGDVGFGDRFDGTWWAEYDPGFAADDDPTRDPDAQLVGSPADPLDVVGPVEWLRLAARVRNQSDARFLAAIHRVAHHHNAHDPGGHPVRDPFAADEVGAALG